MKIKTPKIENMECKLSGSQKRDDELVKIKDNLVALLDSFQSLASIVEQNGKFELHKNKIVKDGQIWDKLVEFYAIFECCFDQRVTSIR